MLRVFLLVALASATLPVLAMGISIFSKSEVIKAKSDVSVKGLDRSEFYELLDAFAYLYGPDRINSLKLAVDGEEDEDQGQDVGGGDGEEFHIYSELVPYTSEEEPSEAEETEPEKDKGEGHLEDDGDKVKEFIQKLEEAQKLKGQESKTAGSHHHHETEPEGLPHQPDEDQLDETDSDEALMKEFEEILKALKDEMDGQAKPTKVEVAEEKLEKTLDKIVEESKTKEDGLDDDKMEAMLETAVKEFEKELLQEKKVHVYSAVSNKKEELKEKEKKIEGIWDALVDLFTSSAESGEESRTHQSTDDSSTHIVHSLPAALDKELESLIETYEKDKTDKAFAEDVLELLEKTAETKGQEAKVSNHGQTEVDQSLASKLDNALEELFLAYEKQEHKEDGLEKLLEKTEETQGQEAKTETAVVKLDNEWKDYFLDDDDDDDDKAKNAFAEDVLKLLEAVEEAEGQESKTSHLESDNGDHPKLNEPTALLDDATFNAAFPELSLILDKPASKPKPDAGQSNHPKPSSDTAKTSHDHLSSDELLKAIKDLSFDAILSNTNHKDAKPETDNEEKVDEELERWLNEIHEQAVKEQEAKEKQKQQAGDKVQILADDLAKSEDNLARWINRRRAPPPPPPSMRKRNSNSSSQRPAAAERPPSSPRLLQRI